MNCAHAVMIVMNIFLCKNRVVQMPLNLITLIFGMGFQTAWTMCRIAVLLYFSPLHCNWLSKKVIFCSKSQNLLSSLSANKFAVLFPSTVKALNFITTGQHQETSYQTKHLRNATGVSFNLYKRDELYFTFLY